MDQLRAYESVDVIRGRVTAIDEETEGLRVGFAAGKPVVTRLVLLAVGMIDSHLEVAGFSELWGDTVIHCPYCHGWEARDLPWAVYVTRDEPFPALARICSWSNDVMLIVKDGVRLQPETERKLQELGYAFERGTISALHATGGKLESIELEGGRRLSRQVLLYSPPQRQTPLVEALGLALDDDGYVATDDSGLTSMPGVYAAGDLVTPRQQIVIAAANGVMTAIAMDTVLAMSA